MFFLSQTKSSLTPDDDLCVHFYDSFGLLLKTLSKPELPNQHTESSTHKVCGKHMKIKIKIKRQ